MEIVTNRAWKAKTKRTNPDIYYSDKVIGNPQTTNLACKAIGSVAMGLMNNYQIIYSDNKEIGAYYDKSENHIYIFQKGEQLQFKK